MINRPTISARLALLAATVALLLLAPVQSEGGPVTWGAWPSRNMVSAARGLPDSFDLQAGRNVRWVVPLGTQTFSSPVAAAGRVLIGTNNDRPRDPKLHGDSGVLLCLSTADGHMAWQLVVPKVGGSPYNDWPETGLVCPATVDGDRVYLVTNRNEVVSLRLDGSGSVSPLWRFDIVAECGTHRHDAAHGSVLVDGPFLYVNTSNGVDDRHQVTPCPNAPSLIALDKATGRLVAQDDLRLGPMSIHNQWASPSAGTVKGRRLIFFGGGDGVCYAFEPPAAAAPGARPAALKCVWRFDCDTSAPKSDIFRYQDNRSEGPSTIEAMPVFVDGRVYVAAGGDLWHGKPKSWLRCIDASGQGDITRTGAVWSYEMPSFCTSTPAIVGGLVFATDARGTVHCLDQATGKLIWKQDLGEEVWGSPLAADGKLFVGTRNGTVWVLAASRTKRVLSSARLDSAIHASPCAFGDTLYVATMSRLYAFGRRGR